MATFGDTTVGSVDNNFGANELHARKFTSFPGGDVSSIAVSCRYKGATDGLLKCALYAANGSGGSPGTRLWVSEQYTVTSAMTTHAFRTMNTSGGGSVSVSAQDLWMAVFVGGPLYLSDNSDGGTCIYGETSYSSAPAASWAYGTDAFNKLTRVYITYAVAASGPSMALLNHLLLGD